MAHIPRLVRGIQSSSGWRGQALNDDPVLYVIRAFARETTLFKRQLHEMIINRTTGQGNGSTP